MSNGKLKGEVGGRLKAVRGALGFTQKALCALIEMPLPSLRDYELGKTIPGGKALEKLTRAGVNTGWLLSGEGKMLLSLPDEAQRPPGERGGYPADNAFNAEPDHAAIVTPVTQQAADASALDASALAGAIQMARAFLGDQATPDSVARDAADYYAEGMCKRVENPPVLNIDVVSVMIRGALKALGVSADPVSVARTVAEFYELKLGWDEHPLNSPA